MERLGGLGGWTEFVEELNPVEGDIARCINVELLSLSSQVPSDPKLRSFCDGAGMWLGVLGRGRGVGGAGPGVNAREGVCAREGDRKVGIGG